jgi:hypothetical protein
MVSMLSQFFFFFFLTARRQCAEVCSGHGPHAGGGAPGREPGPGHQQDR